MYYVKNQYIKLGKLDINIDLFDFVKNEVVPKTNIDSDSFWNSFEKIVSEFVPINKELLKERNELQEKIDAWHIENRIRKHDPIAYKNFLKSIGYLVEEPDDFEIKTENIDTEISYVAGPQLVVPLDNARYALNAANARWGSLYDAMYSTNTITEANGCKKIKKYNPIRGDRVITRSRNFLDRHFALERDTHKHITQYFVRNTIVFMKNASKTPKYG